MLMILGYAGCSKAETRNSSEANRNSTEQVLQAYPTDHRNPVDTEVNFEGFLARILEEAEIPAELARNIQATAAEGPALLLDLLAALAGDPYLRVLVDKKHALPLGYAPDDLVELTGGFYQVSRRGLLLRRSAETALEEMAAAAQADGVILTVSSAYRSYSYQETVYARNVRESGQETADRESARPGYSQHQLGLVVDFGSIDDSFAETSAGRWIVAHASSFGWSLSFPQDYEAITGYRWESWHYRYVGRELTYFMDTYFNGIQQYALQFIYCWEKAGGL
ncbi:MAG: M15 family metallopeptidase [Treponema sp.]|jgi:D-alanyl-D-alanine carboxypeptidase|nr:M15 family metallopeptidase [Treponema sp.]